MNALIRNNVRVWGNPQSGKTIVFCHGFGTDQSAWAQVAAAFRHDYRIVTFDIVGSGQSDSSAFDANYYDDVTAYAQDLVEILDQLDLRDVVLVGHSMGGMFSILAALACPERVGSLVTIGASARYLDDEGYRGGFTQADLDTFFEAMRMDYQAWASGFAVQAMGTPDRPELGDSFAICMKRIRPDVALSVLRLVMHADIRDRLDELKLPVLLIQTKEDIAVPIEAAEYLHKAIAGSELALIDATGHLPHFSAAAEVIRAMMAWSIMRNGSAT